MRQPADRSRVVVVQPRRWYAVILISVLLLLAGCVAPSPIVQRAPLPSVTPAPAPPAIATLVPTSATPAPPTATVSATPTPIVPATATPLTIVPTPTLATFDQEQRATLFDQVWDLVNTHYLYADFKGVDWNALKAQYRPQALAAPSSAEFYATLRAMVDQLRDQHSRFQDPQRAFSQQALASGTDTDVGIGILFAYTGEGLLVTTVFPDSPAVDAGIQRRDMIVAIDGQPIDPHTLDVRGAVGSTVELQVRTPEGDLRTLTLKRRAFVTQYVPEANLLPGTRTGYLLIQSFWAQDMAARTETALRDLIDQHGRLDGLIIDVRGNGGGWRDVLLGLLSNFVSGDVGAFYDQRQSYPLTIEANALHDRLRNVPLVVLVDHGTQSYAEVFAAVLRETRGAQVIGETTAGNTETIFAYDLEDGSRLWVAQQGFRLRDGADLEGQGVVPDYVLQEDWTRFSEQRDPFIAKATTVLQAQAGANE